MSRLEIETSLVDGGMLDATADDSFVARYRKLVAEGYAGKHLVHELLTDDWGAPPRSVRIFGTMDTGEIVNILIPYD